MMMRMRPTFLPLFILLQDILMCVDSVDDKIRDKSIMINKSTTTLEKNQSQIRYVPVIFLKRTSTNSLTSNAIDSDISMAKQNWRKGKYELDVPWDSPNNHKMTREEKKILAIAKIFKAMEKSEARKRRKFVPSAPSEETNFTNSVQTQNCSEEMTNDGNEKSDGIRTCNDSARRRSLRDFIVLFLSIIVFCIFLLYFFVLVSLVP